MKSIRWHLVEYMNMLNCVRVPVVALVVGAVLPVVAETRPWCVVTATRRFVFYFASYTVCKDSS